MKPEVIYYPDFEETKKRYQVELDKFKTVSTDTKENKKAQAKLNKLAKEINDLKKSVKAEQMAPLKEFEAQAKELMSMVETVKAPIHEALAAVQEEEKQAAEKAVKKIIADLAFSRHIDPEEVEIKSKWLTKSISITELQREIAEELDLMLHFDKGILPDGVNRVKGNLINDDGELVKLQKTAIYVTQEQWDSYKNWAKENGVTISKV